MRWAARFLFVLALAWAIYFVSPYVSFYGLAKAVEARDAAAIERRVNFRAVRASLARQLVPAFLAASGREAELKGARGNAVIGFGATIADPLLAQYISPEALADFLSDPAAALGDAPASSGRTSRITIDSLRAAWRLFVTAETRGFRVISFAVPVEKPRQQRFRLQMRVYNLGWRLVGIEAPKPVLQRLVQELIKRNPAGA